ncbi:MAG: hypothetical protein ACRBK7_07250 [Acidimicrobiales bacterium]
MKRTGRSLVGAFLAIALTTLLTFTGLVPSGVLAQLAESPHDPEDLRQDAIAELVGALEAYGDSNGTYMVDGAGFKGYGTGWGYYEEAGTDYPISTVSVLIAEGHLAEDAGRDPLWANSMSIKGDVLIYLCRDRVAVFTRHSASEPSASDSSWWTDNSCNRYPIDNLDATYYQLSEPLFEEDRKGCGITIYAIPRLNCEERDRQDAIAELIEALVSYGDSNGTYMVDGGGSRGYGSGWAYYEEAGTNYPISTVNVLIAEGHLAEDAGRDPLWTNSMSIKGDVLIYLCRDRVAVFSRHSASEPSASDSSWWTNNSCNRYPIDNLDATYYQLSEPLPKLG